MNAWVRIGLFVVVVLGVIAYVTGRFPGGRPAGPSSGSTSSLSAARLAGQGPVSMATSAGESVIHVTHQLVNIRGQVIRIPVITGEGHLWDERTGRVPGPMPPTTIDGTVVTEEPDDAEPERREVILRQWHELLVQQARALGRPVSSYADFRRLNLTTPVETLEEEFRTWTRQHVMPDR